MHHVAHTPSLQEQMCRDPSRRKIFKKIESHHMIRAKNLTRTGPSIGRAHGKQIGLLKLGIHLLSILGNAFVVPIMQLIVRLRNVINRRNPNSSIIQKLSNA